MSFRIHQENQINLNALVSHKLPVAESKKEEVKVPQIVDPVESKESPVPSVIEAKEEDKVVMSIKRKKQ